MKNLFALMLYSMTISESVNASDVQLEDLESLRWQHRVILVFAREPGASKAIANLQAFAAGIDDRDIAWFVLDGATLRSNYTGTLDETLPGRLMERYFTPRPDNTAVLLIGKDGGVKSRSSDLDLEAMFGLIDQMPMRRQEMRRGGDASS